MTWTGDPVWLADVLRAEGIKVVEYPGWKDRGHGDMGTIWGVVAHHTGNNPPGKQPRIHREPSESRLVLADSPVPRWCRHRRRCGCRLACRQRIVPRIADQRCE